MAEKERLTEQIKYLIELLRLMWLTMIAVGGGTIGLLLGEVSPLRSRLAVAGIVVVVIIVVAIGHLHRRVRAEIERLKEV